MVEVVNIFANLPARLPEEVVERLLTTANVRIERIVSLGHASPEGFWYDQEDAEWVILLQGAARLRFAGDESDLELKPGDYVSIPAHRRHRVAWTDPNTPTVWLAIHERADLAR